MAMFAINSFALETLFPCGNTVTVPTKTHYLGDFGAKRHFIRFYATDAYDTSVQISHPSCAPALVASGFSMAWSIILRHRMPFNFFMIILLYSDFS
jgi:hypothetical protein